MRNRNILSIILAFAKAHDEFTPRDVPGLTVQQANRCCPWLARAGELELVEKGSPGRHHHQPIYRFVPQQRGTKTKTK